MRLGPWQSGHLGALLLSGSTLVRAWLVPSVGDTTTGVAASPGV